MNQYVQTSTNGFREQIRKKNNSHKLPLLQFIETNRFLIQFAMNHSLKELMTAALDSIEKLTESRISFIHFVDSDHKTFSLQQWSSNTLAEFCRAFCRAGYLKLISQFQFKGMGEKGFI